jgi:hypothetical protein
MKNYFLPSLAIATLAATSLIQAGVAPTATATSIGDPTPVIGYDFGQELGTQSATLVPTGATVMNFSHVGGNGSHAETFERHPGNQGFRANGFATGNTIDKNKGFFEMIVAPNQAGKIVFNGICFDVRRVGNASSLRMALRSSLDSFQSDLFTPFELGNNNDWNHHYRFFDPIEATSSITFRLYPFLSGGGGDSDDLKIDQVYLKGYTAAAETVPTPALLPALAGMGLAVVRKRKRAMTQTA